MHFALQLAADDSQHRLLVTISALPYLSLPARFLFSLRSLFLIIVGTVRRQLLLRESEEDQRTAAPDCLLETSYEKDP